MKKKRLPLLFLYRKEGIAVQVAAKTNTVDSILLGAPTIITATVGMNDVPHLFFGGELIYWATHQSRVRYTLKRIFDSWHLVD